MEYEEIQLAAKQAKTTQELCQVNDKAEQLFWAGKLKMTDVNWADFTRLIDDRHSALTTK